MLPPVLRPILSRTPLRTSCRPFSNIDSGNLNVSKSLEKQFLIEEPDYSPLFPDNFSSRFTPKIPSSPSFLQNRTSAETGHENVEGNGPDSNLEWFKVRHFIKPNSLFGILKPKSKEESLMQKVESRSILHTMPRDIMWHGNHLSKASSPAARLLQRQRLNLETHMRAKHLGTNEDIESSETTGNKQSKDLLNENLESSESTIADSIAGELFPPRIVVHCRQNNIFLAVCQANGLPLKFWSSGMLGYKNAMKTTQKAALALMDTLYDYLAEKSITKVRLEFKGVNTARQVILSQFRKNGLAITHVIDTTPIPNGGGPRPKKARRL